MVELVNYWDVISTLERGRSVRCVDLEKDQLFWLNDLPVNEFFCVMKRAEEGDGLYLFYAPVDEVVDVENLESEVDF